MLNLSDTIRDLRWELEKVNQAITVLEHIPANPTQKERRGRRSMCQEEREEVSRRNEDLLGQPSPFPDSVGGLTLRRNVATVVGRQLFLPTRPCPTPPPHAGPEARESIGAANFQGRLLRLSFS
jgi:hypothetical protein